MSSRSSSERAARALPVGRVAGHRGRGGELTVRVGGGDATVWVAAQRFWIGRPEGGRIYRVENSRGYRDRLVLKLEGIDDADAAARLRGCDVGAPKSEAASLGDGEYHAAQLVGMTVQLENGLEIGEVRELLATGGADLLLVRPIGTSAGHGEDLMVPLAKEIVVEIQVDRQRIVIRPPDGLLDLNRKASS